MSRSRAAVTTITLLALGACGGGDGSADPNGAQLPGEENSSFGNSCDIPYYRTLIGTYKGNVLYEFIDVDDSILQRCDWSMTAVVEIESDTFACRLRMVLRSELEQSIVLPASSPYASQCMEENSLRSLREPNDSPDLASFDDVAFPVIADLERSISAPRSGPYFGDETAIVDYRYLFDSNPPMVDVIRFDGLGGLELVDPDPSDNTGVAGILLKE